MSEEKEKPEDVHAEPENDELKPVKGKPKKILALGCSIAVGATVTVVFLGVVSLLPATMGAPRSALLKFEQRKQEIERQIEQGEQGNEPEQSEPNSAM